LDGKPGPGGGSAASSNGLLHEDMLAYLNRPSRPRLVTTPTD